VKRLGDALVEAEEARAEAEAARADLQKHVVCRRMWNVGAHARAASRAASFML